jgi:hypothetical protein
VKASQDKARSHEVLFHAIVLAILKECGIELNFRPEFAENAILQGIVQEITSPDEVRIGSRSH